MSQRVAPAPSRRCQAAVEAAARGWPVMALHALSSGQCTCGRPECSSAGKHPRTWHGLLDASTDPNQILHWWQRWPNSNLGVVTGKSSGLLVIDVDPRHGGDIALGQLEREHGRLPNTIETVTGSGGRHILFQYRAHQIVRNSAGRIGPGIDVRGEGGYFVAPPSMHASGARYCWLSHHDPDHIGLAPAPVWILSRLAQSTERRRLLPMDPAARIIREGERNMSLTRLAGSMRYHGADGDTILAALRAHNARYCSLPLPDQELRRIVASISRYPCGSRLGERR